MQKPTAIVIGAGIGGIATAARLAKNGYEVTVLEKEPTPGGRCNQIIRDGHRFDIGPTLFLMPEIWEETFASLGEKMGDHLDLIRIDPTYKVYFEDGLQLQLTSNIGAMQTQLEKVEKTAFTGFLNYIAEGSKQVPAASSSTESARRVSAASQVVGVMRMNAPCVSGKRSSPLVRCCPCRCAGPSLERGTRGACGRAMACCSAQFRQCDRVRFPVQPTSPRKRTRRCCSWKGHRHSAAPPAS